MTEHHKHEPEHQEHEHHEHRPIDYADAIASFRAEKDTFFGSNEHSPIPAAERVAFTGLPYYPVDPTLRFAPLRRAPAASRRTSRSRPRTASFGRRTGRARSPSRSTVRHDP